MMDNKRRLAFLAALALILPVSGCKNKENIDSSQTSVQTTETTTVISDVSQITADDLEIGYDESESTAVTFSDGSVEVKGDGASAKGTVLTISKAGTYILSGECSDGQIVVSAEKTDKVRLVLNGIKLSCKSYAPLSVKKAEKVTLILEDGSQNSFSDGDSYVTTDEDNANAAVFSKSDLTINGGGSLEVSANYKNGIVSKNDLIITGGNIKVASASSALVGKDSVSVSAGSFDLTSGTDCIKSTNKKEEGNGCIGISGGDFKIRSDGDAVNASGDISISGGSFAISTGEGAASVSHKQEMPFGGGNKGEMPDGFAPDDMPKDLDPDKMPEGFDPDNMPKDFDPSKMKDGFDPGKRPSEDDIPDTIELPDIPVGSDPAQPADIVELGFSEGSADADDSSDSVSQKGLKADRNIVIEGGTFDFDTADDSIHGDSDCEIKGGTLNIASGDDGIHIENTLVISGGNVNVNMSYEGIEGKVVSITGGNVDITAYDDGINCADPEGSSRDMFTAQEGVALNISGGNVNVNSGGDGLDSNGELNISGGTTYVSGPENGGNGSIDHNGGASITGGTIIASGAVGMEEMFEENGSTQCAVLHDFSSSFAADTEFTVKDSSGKVILSFTNPKTWQGVIFSSPELKKGETYTVSAGDENDEITLDSVITSNGSGFGFGGGPGGGPGGKEPPDDMKRPDGKPEDRGRPGEKGRPDDMGEPDMI